MIDKNESIKAKVVSCFEDLMSTEQGEIKKYDIDTLVHTFAFSAACMTRLKQFRVTPKIAAEIALHYMIYQSKPKASIIILNRYNKIKIIDDIARNYRARLTDFVDKITLYCNEQKSSKCIIIYNYNHKVSGYRELVELDMVYNALAESDITLVDAIRVTKGKATPLISGLNSSGYKTKKNVR